MFESVLNMPLTEQSASKLAIKKLSIGLLNVLYGPWTSEYRDATVSEFDEETKTLDNE